MTSARASLCQVGQELGAWFFTEITFFYPTWACSICWPGKVSSWSCVPWRAPPTQQQGGKVKVALRVSPHFHVPFQKRAVPSLSSPPKYLRAVFVKLISCCLWASLKCPISAWVLPMKLSSAFASARAADELPKLGPSHCCDPTAGRTRWPPSSADFWAPTHGVTHHKMSASLWQGCGDVLSDESRMLCQ